MYGFTFNNQTTDSARRRVSAIRKADARVFKFNGTYMRATQIAEAAGLARSTVALRIKSLRQQGRREFTSDDFKRAKR